MPSRRARERFAPEEAAAVVRETGIPRLGRIERVVEFNRGSSRSPKLLIESAGRRWLLKRRAPANSGHERVRFCQHFQRLLAEARVPVTPALPFIDGTTALARHGHVYEYFDFVEGSRYDRSAAAALGAGEALGLLLRAAARTSPSGDSVHGTFHASGVILGAVHLARDAVESVEPDADRAGIRRTTDSLRRLYRSAAERAMRSRFAATGVHPIHGDYHPGNLLFQGERVAAIVDFDAARVEPRAVEVANAILQVGSLRLPGHDADAWPEALDPLLVGAIVGGLRNAGLRLETQERDAIPWLMIEACIAEGIVPIARTGMFAELRGSAMLRFLERRAAWLRDTADRWLEALSS